jgi:hypothetical protein
VNRIGIDDEKLCYAVIDYTVTVFKRDLITNRYVLQAAKKSVAMASERQITGSAKRSGARHAAGTQVENSI